MKHEELEYTRFSIFGPPDEVGPLLQQLAWLTAVFTLPTPNALTISTAVLKVGLGSIDIWLKKIDLRTLMLDSVGHEEAPICWHRLLRGAVLAYGFPISKRRGGTGLEIPFNLMAGLADIRTKIDIGGGAALLGGSGILLYPSKALEDGTQWHCVEVNDDDDYAKYPSSSSPVLESVDFKKLSSPSHRTFLGYYPQAKVHLGTRELVESMAGTASSSGLESSPERIELAKEGTFTGGFSIKGIFNFSTGGKWAMSRTLQASLQDPGYHKLVDDTQLQPVLL
jgi:hypothetical protein